MPALTTRPTQTKREQVLRPFRLKLRSFDGQPVGKHIQNDPKVARLPGESYEDYTERAETIYFPGDIVESYEDLASQSPEKYERADGYTDPNANPYLNQMAPGELPEDFERRMARLRGSAPVANTAGQNQTNAEHKQVGDIPVDPVAGAAKQGANRLSHLKLEQMTPKQLQEIIDTEEIDTDGKTLVKVPEMAKAIRDWMGTNR